MLYLIIFLPEMSYVILPFQRLATFEGVKPVSVVKIIYAAKYL